MTKHHQPSRLNVHLLEFTEIVARRASGMGDRDNPRRIRWLWGQCREIGSRRRRFHRGWLGGRHRGLKLVAERARRRQSGIARGQAQARTQTAAVIQPVTQRQAIRGMFGEAGLCRGSYEHWLTHTLLCRAPSCAYARSSHSQPQPVHEASHDHRAHPRFRREPSTPLAASAQTMRAPRCKPACALSCTQFGW